jgi:hypothetical protein
LAKKLIPEFINGFKIINESGSINNKRRMFLILCHSCGKEFISELQNIKKIKSCGCLWRTNIPKRLRSIFSCIKSRCYDPSHASYKSYGGKGIHILEDWLNNPMMFFVWSLNSGYQAHLTIDRISPELGYFPENCQWITMQEQIQRRRTITKLTPELIIAMRTDLLVMKNIDVSKKYGISKSHVSCIKSRKHWGNI